MMRTFILAIDPGNNSGFTFGFSDSQPTSALHDFSPKPATKSRPKEPEHLRFGKLLSTLSSIVTTGIQSIIHLDEPFTVHIICENATGFTRGKAPVAVSNQYRGVVKAFAAYKNYKYEGIEPRDLQRFATGKGKAEKTEVMEVAKARYGYQGNDDNESDSVIMWHFVKEQLDRDPKTLL